MESPQRPRLIPVWAIVVPVLVFLLGIGSIVTLVWARQSSYVAVPNVSGLDVASARTRVTEAGLLLKQGDRRFSPTVAVDGVIDQLPAAGSRVPRGSTVTVVLSAGSASFAMPDVVGMKLDVARKALTAKGLIVETGVMASDRDKNTVLSASPAPGVTVSASDTVKLTVSSGAASGSSDLLQPVDLSGKTFVIDPAPSSGSATDTAMEIQRRLNSLLEASGAKVAVTRGVNDSAQTLTPGMRALRAQTASATAVIGLEVAPTGTGGFTVSTAKSGSVPSAAYIGSGQLSQALVKTLGSLREPVRSAEVAGDAVLQGSSAPGIRLTLGSLADKADAKRLADPVWQDRVAQALYAAIGKVYASPAGSSAATGTP